MPVSACESASSNLPMTPSTYAADWCAKDWCMVPPWSRWDMLSISLANLRAPMQSLLTSGRARPASFASCARKMASIAMMCMAWSSSSKLRAIRKHLRAVVATSRAFRCISLLERSCERTQRACPSLSVEPISWKASIARSASWRAPGKSRMAARTEARFMRATPRALGSATSSAMRRALFAWPSASGSMPVSREFFVSDVKHRKRSLQSSISPAYVSASAYACLASETKPARCCTSPMA
mmetsp:Transcript_98249/g.305920  ORF Transcript_98249/g.305920 Transcript_98249/m.305920 type:complete len:240 (-) Transcript_98249:111-830(-)